MTRGRSSIPEVRRLLSVLAVGRKVGEAGTAFGEGTRAMASTAASVVTVEMDERRAELAAAALRDVPKVQLLVGDWRQVLPERAPFGLLFLDAGGFKEAPFEVGPLAVGLLERGGLLVVDDMTPGLSDHDPAREFLFGYSELTSVEVNTTPETSAIISARL